MSKNRKLMRDTAVILFAAAVNGVLNVVFDIDIPDKYALEIAEIDFILSTGAVPADNRLKFYLVDDPDEDADPGHAAEKVIQSTEIHIDTAASANWNTKTLDCHETLLVRSPNFIAVCDNVPGVDLNMMARIWFDFTKVSPDDVVDLMKQTQY